MVLWRSLRFIDRNPFVVAVFRWAPCLVFNYNTLIESSVITMEHTWYEAVQIEVRCNFSCSLGVICGIYFASHCAISIILTCYCINILFQKYVCVLFCNNDLKQKYLAKFELWSIINFVQMARLILSTQNGLLRIIHCHVLVPVSLMCLIQYNLWIVKWRHYLNAVKWG